MTHHRTIGDVASLVRSKNAGPFWLTFDIFCDSDDAFEQVAAPDVLTAERIADLYEVDSATVKIFRIPEIRVVKVTVPRPSTQGGVRDRDMHSGQQHVPLMRVPITGGAQGPTMSETEPRMWTTAHLGREHPGFEFLTGSTPFFAYQGDQRFSYCLYVPETYQVDEPNQPLLVAVHGTDRDAGPTRDLFVDLADATGCLVLAPLFPAGIGHPNDLDTYKFIDRAGVRYDHVLLGMVAEVRHRWGINAERFHLCGFSGGGHFAHRFLYLHPNRLASVSIGAPGRTTLLDDSMNWPDGVADLHQRFDVELDVTAIARVPVQVVVGELDSEIRTGQPGGDRSRLDRARDLAESLSAAGCDVEFAVVPGAAHSSTDTAPTVAAYLARQI